MNGAGGLTEGPSSDKCSVDEQHGPGPHPTAARMKRIWEVNKIFIQDFFKSKVVNEDTVLIRVHRKRMFREWSKTL